MNHFKQHIPSFFEGFAPIEFDFNTTEELIERLSNRRSSLHKNYSMSDNCLMEVENNGKHWVIGYILYPEEIDLPKF